MPTNADEVQDEVLTMPVTDFINRRDYLEFEGFGPGPLSEIDEAKWNKRP
jgi:hypothetical protein